MNVGPPLYSQAFYRSDVESPSYHLNAPNTSDNHITRQIERQKSVTDMRNISEPINNNGFLSQLSSSTNTSQMLKLDQSDILANSGVRNLVVSPTNKRNSASFFTANIIASNNNNTALRRPMEIETQQNQSWFNASQRELQNLQPPVNFF